MTSINKKSLTERDICTIIINPAIEAAGWDLMHQVREQYCCTKGRVMVRGKTPLKTGSGILGINFWNTGYVEGAQDFSVWN